jgi:hypothetical protein
MEPIPCVNPVYTASTNIGCLKFKTVKKYDTFLFTYLLFINIFIHLLIYVFIKKKSKAVPLQAWSGPEGSTSVN